MLLLWLPAKEARSVSQESLSILAELNFVFYPQSTRKIFAALQSDYIQNSPFSLPAYQLVLVSWTALPSKLNSLHVTAFLCPMKQAPHLSTVLPIDSHVSN